MYLCMALLDEEYIDSLYTDFSGRRDPWFPDDEVSLINDVWHYGLFDPNIEEDGDKKRIYGQRVKMFADFLRTRFREMGIPFVSVSAVKDFANALYGAVDVDVNELIRRVDGCSWRGNGYHQFSTMDGAVQKYKEYLTSYLKGCRVDDRDSEEEQKKKRLKIRKLLKFWHMKEYELLGDGCLVQVYAIGRGDYGVETPPRAMLPKSHGCQATLDLYDAREPQELFAQKLYESSMNADVEYAGE